MKPVKTEKISLSAARRLAVHAQLLDGRTRLPSGKEGVARAVEKMGYVQIDTIAVIERAHHHTLWSRCPNYRPDLLHELQARDRRVFEYWGHAASYLPMCDYRYYLPRMRAFYDPRHKWEKARLEKYGYLMKPVLERIRREGPLGSSDFAPPEGRKRGTWWDWRPTKVALELLFCRGDLMITERRNFHRIYDLTERVLPGGIDTRYPDDTELGRFLVRRALNAYGVARESEIRDHINAADKEVIGRSLRDMVGAGEVTVVKVAGIENADHYILPEFLGKTLRPGKKKLQLHLLSPFDNLIIQRERTAGLFGFDYALECYVPAAKRKYGYFVLPIMWGEKFVGRLDPKADRSKKVLTINSIYLEDGTDADGVFLEALVRKLWDLARFNGCENDITIKKSHPKKFAPALKRYLRNSGS